MIYNNEKMIYDTLSQKSFFKVLGSKDYDIDILTTLFDEEEFQTIDKCEFNNILQTINKVNKFPMFDMLLYLDKNVADLKKVMTVLDDKSKAILKEESKKRFHIKLSECSLMDLFNG